MSTIQKIEFRAALKFLTKLEKTPEIIVEEMSSAYGDSCPGKTMIFKWHGLFNQGRESIEDDDRPGRPIEATSSDNVEKVEKLVPEDARLKKNQLAEMVGIT